LIMVEAREILSSPQTVESTWDNKDVASLLDSMREYLKTPIH